MLPFAMVVNDASPVFLYVITIVSPVFIFVNPVSVFATKKANPVLYNFDSLCPFHACWYWWYFVMVFFGIVHPMLVIIVGIWYFQPNTASYSYIFVKSHRPSD